MMSWSSWRKREYFFCYVYFVRRKFFFNICVLSQCVSYWIRFLNIYSFTFQTTLLNTHFCLFLKSLKTFSVSLSDSYIKNDEFLSVDNVIREYSEMKEEIRNSENAIYNIKKLWKTIVSGVKNTGNKNSSVRRIRQNRLMLS